MSKQLEQFQQQLENGQLAQSFLIVGPEKTGKFFTTVEMIGLLNNLNDEQLIDVRDEKMVDTIFIESEETTARKEKTLKKKPKKAKREKKPKKIIAKEQIDKMMKQIALKNFQLNKKVVVIKEADKLHNVAANTLLKTLEEPTDDLVIFLLASDEDSVLPTIKSRCQVVRFSFLSDKQIGEIIQKECSVDEELMHKVVDLSGGRIELAREYANDPKQVKIAQEVRDKFRKALRGGKLEQIKLVDELVKADEDLLWVMNEWVWYLKFFLEKNIQENQPVAVIKKVHAILKSLLDTRSLVRTTNVSKKVQLENFFVQI
jgi:DNA polymerase-3 subunit delta'